MHTSALFRAPILPQDGWEPAWNLFSHMKLPSSSLKPNTITYNILMSACLAHGQPTKVRVAERVRGRGVGHAGHC